MIRKICCTDYDKILQIWLEASLKAHDFIDADYWFKMLPAVREYYLPRTETYVYIDRRQIKGFISLTENNYIGALFVAGAEQNKGIGSKLLNYVRRHRPALTLKVFCQNAQALSFYQKQGFKIISEQVDPSSQKKELLMSWAVGCISGFHQRVPGDS